MMPAETPTPKVDTWLADNSCDEDGEQWSLNDTSNFVALARQLERANAALGVERTEGGSLPIQKMLNKIKGEV